MVAKSETFLGSLEDVRAFCAVIDFGTISKAGREIGQSKGGVSRRISRLEKSLGVVLLARNSRAIAASDEGLEFYAKARAAISLLDAATEDSRQSRATLRGSIRITAPIDLAVEVLPDIVTSFRRSHPEITIEILATDALIDLTANRADLAFRIGVGPLPDTGYQATLIGEIEIGIFAAPAYLDGAKAPSSPKDLQGHELIFSLARSGLTHIVFSDGRREETLAVRPAVKASDFACGLRLAIAGAGIAPLPVIIARKWIANGSLVRVLPKWGVSGPTLDATGPALYAISSPGRQLSARVRAFRDCVIASLNT